MTAAQRRRAAPLDGLAATSKRVGIDDDVVPLLPAMPVMEAPIAVSSGGVPSIVVFTIVTVAISPDCIAGYIDSSAPCILDLEAAGSLTVAARGAGS